MKPRLNMKMQGPSLAARLSGGGACPGLYFPVRTPWASGEKAFQAGVALLGYVLARQRLDRPADELLSSTAVPQVSQLRSATSLTRIPHLPSFLYCTGARARRDSAYYTAALARSTGTGRACPPGSEGPSEADSVIEKSYPSAGAPGRSRGRKKIATMPGREAKKLSRKKLA